MLISIKFLLLFFVLNLLQQMTVGMENPSSSVVLHNPPRANNKIHFTLTELSFLARILISIESDEYNELTHEDKIEKVIENKGNEILENLNLTNDQLLLSSINKIKEYFYSKLINQYKSYLNGYLNQLHANIENMSKTQEYKKSFDKSFNDKRPRNCAVEFVSKRINDLSKIFTEKEYEQWQHMESIDSSYELLNPLSEEELEEYLNKFKYPTVHEENLFIYYHLLAQTKILINLYLNSPEDISNYYNSLTFLTIEQTFVYNFLNEIKRRENYQYFFLINFEIYNTKLINNFNALRTSAELDNDLPSLTSFGFINTEIPFKHQIIKFQETQLGESSHSGGSGRGGRRRGRRGHGGN